MKPQTITHLIGSGGWDHEVFDRCLYPDRILSSESKLAFYSRFFDAVEIRSSFWDDSLTPMDARAWIDAVQENRRFQFSVKLHSSFTHRKEFDTQRTRRVRAVLQELERADKLGAVLAQFPVSFTNTGSHRQHLRRIAEVFRGFPLFVEVRHSSWNQPRLKEFILEQAVSLVQTDLPRLKPLMPFLTTSTGPTVYLRLHGRNDKGWLLNAMDTRYDYLYNSREIVELKRRLEVVASKCTRLFVVFNNTTGGKAIANAFQLLSAVRGTRQLALPGATLRAFPHLSEIGTEEPSGGLFEDHEYREAS